MQKFYPVECQLLSSCVALCKRKINEENGTSTWKRFLLNDSFASYEQLLIGSGMNSLQLCRVRALAIEVYKCLNEMSVQMFERTSMNTT